MSGRAAFPAPADRSRRVALTLVATGALPFLAGRVLTLLAGPGLEDAPAVCPFRAATGLPCPLCGATRAVALASSGDGDFVAYNPFWVGALLATCLLGVVALVFARRDVDVLGRAAAAFDAVRRRPAVFWPALALLVLVPWAWAMANRATIVGAT